MCFLDQWVNHVVMIIVWLPVVQMHSPEWLYYATHCGGQAHCCFGFCRPMQGITHEFTVHGFSILPLLVCSCCASSYWPLFLPPFGKEPDPGSFLQFPLCYSTLTPTQSEDECPLIIQQEKMMQSSCWYTPAAFFLFSCTVNHQLWIPFIQLCFILRTSGAPLTLSSCHLHLHPYNTFSTQGFFPVFLSAFFDP